MSNTKIEDELKLLRAENQALKKESERLEYLLTHFVDYFQSQAEGFDTAFRFDCELFIFFDNVLYVFYCNLITFPRSLLLLLPSIKSLLAGKILNVKRLF